MKQYEVLAVMNGSVVTIRKHFLSRTKAIDYMLRYYENHYIYSFQIQEENVLEKHRIEYKSDDYNRFTVNRVIA